MSEFDSDNCNESCTYSKNADMSICRKCATEHNMLYEQCCLDFCGEFEDYAASCGGCICNHCANSVECIDKCTGESEFGCFACDECINYDGKGTDNRRSRCSQYKVTELYAKRIRNNFKIFNVEERKRRKKMREIMLKGKQRIINKAGCFVAKWILHNCDDGLIIKRKGGSRQIIKVFPELAYRNMIKPAIHKATEVIKVGDVVTDNGYHGEVV